MLESKSVKKSLKGYSRKDLLSKAKERGIKTRWSMNKNRLVEAIEKDMKRRERHFRIYGLGAYCKHGVLKYFCDYCTCRFRKDRCEAFENMRAEFYKIKSDLQPREEKN